jgi:cell wall-associated NlpC family hydrolase
VALYIGGGRVVHAMTPRYGVQVSNVYDSYWVKHYYGSIRPNR